MKSQQKSLEKVKNKLLKKLAQDKPFIAGSLTISGRMCASVGCICRRGQKHQAMSLTYKDENQKTKSLYIPVGSQKKALEWSENYKTMKYLIRELSDVNKKLLILKEDE